MATLGRVFPAVVDLKGTELVLDADADTTITADTDDQIDIKIAGADDFKFTANTLTALSGSTIASNTIAETTGGSGVTIDGLLIKDSGIDLNGVELILDADGDTTITADTDNQIDFKIAGADDFRMTANTLSVLSGTTLNIDSGATIANSGTATGFADLTAVADGSVGSPSIANSGDTNTGIYWPGADQLGLTTAGAAALLIDATGAVTMPLNPAFKATGGSVSNVTGDGTLYQMIFDAEIFDANGDHSNGVFTAPVAGNYFFHATVFFVQTTSSHTLAYMQFVTTDAGTDDTRVVYEDPASSFAASGYYVLAGACNTYLDSGDTIVVKVAASGGSKVIDIDGGYNMSFGGFLTG